MSLTKDDLQAIREVVESTVAPKFEQVDKRFEQIDERFDQVDKRFAQVDERFAQVDERFAQVDERFTQMDERFTQMDVRFEGAEAREEGMMTAIARDFALVYKRFDKVDREISVLQSDMREVKRGLADTVRRSEHYALVDRVVRIERKVGD